MKRTVYLKSALMIATAALLIGAGPARAATVDTHAGSLDRFYAHYQDRGVIGETKSNNLIGGYYVFGNCYSTTDRQVLLDPTAMSKIHLAGKTSMVDAAKNKIFDRMLLDGRRFIGSGISTSFVGNDRASGQPHYG